MNRNIISLLILFMLFIMASPVPADDDLEAARHLFTTGNYKKSIHLLKQITKENSDHTNAWVLLGDCYYGLKKDKKSIKAYQKAILLDPEQVDVLFRSGLVYYRMEKYFKAIDAYKHAIRIKPEHSEAYFWLGVAYNRIANIGKAFEQYKILKSLDKELADKLYAIIFGE